LNLLTNKYANNQTREILGVNASKLTIRFDTDFLSASAALADTFPLTTFSFLQATIHPWDTIPAAEPLL
jgi:hypothetical protein